MVREIAILLSLVDGGVAINLSRSIGEKGPFLAFIHELLKEGGFDGDPRTVNFDRNKLTPDGMKINWFRLRIPDEECRTHHVHAPTVVCNMAKCMRSREFQRKHGLKISLTVKGIDDSRCGGGRGREPVAASVPDEIRYRRVTEGDEELL